MKKISIECAGSGKTYGIAMKIKDCYETCSKYKKIYAITFTNNAVENISREIIKQIGFLPDNVVLQTIHTFMLERVIYPFSKFILNENIISCSIDKLPEDYALKNYYKTQMLKEGILHSQFVMNYGKRIICPTGSDTKKILKRKDIVLKHIINGIETLYIDEIQDMDDDFFKIIDYLANTKLNMYLVGDFRQALKYPKSLLNFLAVNKIFEISQNNVTRRVPEKHLFFANQLFSSNYASTNHKNFQGDIIYSYEDEQNIDQLMNCYNLHFIDKSNEKFTTHNTNDSSLWFTKNEKEEMCGNFKGDNNILTKVIIRILKKRYEIKKDAKYVVKNFFKKDLSSSLYAKLTKMLSDSPQQRHVTNSIEKIKGLEGDKCLFFVSYNMLNILMGNNKRNKETNKLYVALTRSKKVLHLVILDECTQKMSKNVIEKFMQENNVIHS